MFHHEALVLGGLMVVDPDRLSELARDLEAAITGGAELALANAHIGWRSDNDQSAALDAIIPAAVSELEALICALLRIASLIYPDGLNARAKPTTIAEVQERGGVDFTLMHLNDVAARKIVDSGPDSWREQLRKWPGVDATELSPDWDAFTEVFLRRNVLVHTACRADEKYLKAIGSTVRRPQLGELLHCDGVYVLDALDHFLAVGRGLAALWLASLRPRDGFDLHRADEVVFALLERERWAHVDVLTRAFLARSPVDAEHLRVNGWMAQRELAQSVGAVREEVSSWHPKAGVEWELARAALLEDADEVIRLLRGMGREDVRRVARWPLLQQLGRRDTSVRVQLDRVRR